MKNSVLFLFPVLLLTSCSTVVKYDAKTVAAPAKPADYPIYVYAEGVPISRPAEVMGTMHVGDSFFTVTGGSLEGVMKTMRQSAREKGADALQITDVKEPDFASAHFRVDANFLRFTDAWESVARSEDELRAYLKQNQKTLDPLEGVWSGNDYMQSRIGITKSSSKPGRDLIAFILETKNPSWQRGYKKMDLKSGERPGVYRLEYYLEDFQAKRAVIALDGPSPGKFVVRTPDGANAVIFTRE